MEPITIDVVRTVRAVFSRPTRLRRLIALGPSGWRATARLLTARRPGRVRSAARVAPARGRDSRRRAARTSARQHRRQSVSRARRQHLGDVSPAGGSAALHRDRGPARDDLRLPRQPVRPAAGRSTRPRSRRCTRRCSTRSIPSGRSRTTIATGRAATTAATCAAWSPTSAPASQTLPHFAGGSRRGSPRPPTSTPNCRRSNISRPAAAKRCATRGTHDIANDSPGCTGGSSRPRAARRCRSSRCCILASRTGTRRGATSMRRSRAYFPNVSAVHILLDYFIDQAEDREHRELNFVACYASSGEAVERVARLIRSTAERLRDVDRRTTGTSSCSRDVHCST